MPSHDRVEGTRQEGRDLGDPQGRALWRLSLILRDIAACSPAQEASAGDHQRKVEKDDRY